MRSGGLSLRLELQPAVSAQAVEPAWTPNRPAYYYAVTQEYAPEVVLTPRHRFLAVLTLPILSVAVVVSLAFGSTRTEPGTVAAVVDETSEPETVAGPRVVPLQGPWVVAIQPGHWRIGELPDEHARRRANVGASHGGVREVDINVAVTEALVPLLENEGWDIQMIPATVPPGLRADALLSIHADWGADPNRNGWKLAAPWRPSPAASSLAQALRESFGAEPGLREDRNGITVGMRGYFGFASHRFHYASSPYTPAVLVELGFLTNDVERARMVEDPDFYAAVIHRGLVSYFAGRDRLETASLIPRIFEIKTVGHEGAAVRRSTTPDSGVIRHLEAGEIVRPVDEVGGWYEVRIRTPALTGWVRAADLVPFATGTAGDPAPGETGRMPGGGTEPAGGDSS